MAQKHVLIQDDWVSYLAPALNLLHCTLGTCTPRTNNSSTINPYLCSSNLPDQWRQHSQRNLSIYTDLQFLHFFSFFNQPYVFRVVYLLMFLYLLQIARMLTVKREREIEQGINKRLSRKLDRKWKQSIVVRPPPSLRENKEEQKGAKEANLQRSFHASVAGRFLCNFNPYFIFMYSVLTLC